MIKISEKDFEDIIFDRIQTKEGCEELTKRGLHTAFHEGATYYRQLNLKQYGIADVVRIHSSAAYGLSVEVIELKVTEFCLSHLLQIGRYIACLRRIFEKTYSPNSVSITGRLIVAEFDTTKDYCWIDECLNYDVHVYGTAFSLNGLEFKHFMPSGFYFGSASTKDADYFPAEDIQHHTLRIDGPTEEIKDSTP